MKRKHFSRFEIRRLKVFISREVVCSLKERAMRRRR